MLNQLYCLLRLHPEKDWKWDEVAANVCFGIECVDAFEHVNLESWVFSGNPNVTMAMVLARTDIVWQDEMLCTVLTDDEMSVVRRETFIRCAPLMHKICKAIGVTGWERRRLYDWRQFSKNRRISTSFVDTNIDMDWDWRILSSNRCVTMELVLRHWTKPWDATSLSMNLSIRLNDHMQWKGMYRWNWHWISAYKVRRIEDVLEWLDVAEWNWDGLSRCCGIRFEDVLAHPELGWTMSGLSRNPNVRMHDVLSHLEMDWRFDYLSANPGIRLEDMVAHPELGWNWSFASSNPNVTCSFVSANIDLEWSWEWFSQNMFGKNRFVRERVVGRRYGLRWRLMACERAAAKKELFEPVLDVLRCRIRDVEVGTRSAMLLGRD